ncbi:MULTISPECIES: cytochrome P450 [unclassified Novosphingobium]|uniref:cytochrome P450 n=1 Tax=unclassified Novosphingobium TaxID=2644732 RepID=UPI001CEFBC1E|nr:cytochrome P450 [Novosphingobium sp. FKTRR1]
MAQPSSRIDLFGDAVLADPWPTYRALRDMGSAVWLEQAGVCFIGRYADVRRALNDWQVFSSAQGIGFNPMINAAWEEALICQDPPVHTARRKLMMEALGPAALRPVAETIEQRADALAERVAAMGTFDGVANFAHDLPIGVVMDLIGWPHDVRPRLLDLASGSWNAAGPANARMEQGLTGLQDMMGLLTTLYDEERVLPGGFAAGLIAASHRGEITRETAIGMLAGYVVAAFETTISAMAAGLYLFATNPDQWALLRTDPGLATAAANEIVRMETPLQNFARVTTRDAELSDGSIVPAGTRVVVSYASANRDERQFDAPDTFRIDRREKQNLGFGHGPHGCAGQALARMELTAVFVALARRIERLELAGTPQRMLNNISRAFSHVPLRAICD